MNVVTEKLEQAQIELDKARSLINDALLLGTGTIDIELVNELMDLLADHNKTSRRINTIKKKIKLSSEYHLVA